MTVLLYDYQELEERAGRHLKVWKVWHLILYAMAAIFGIANYILLQSAMQLVDNNCILYPRNLSFRMVPRSEIHIATQLGDNESYFKEVGNDDAVEAVTDTTAEASQNDTKTVEKREVTENATTDEMYVTETTDMQNTTILTGNWSHRWVLDTSRSLFARDSDCQFAEYMPIMSAVCAIVWLTLFTMCPGGGRPRSGLKQPWRILTPALLSAIVLVGLMGHSFARTNSGLQDFCAAFTNYTNSTTCSSAGPLLERNWAAWWGWGGRASSARAASAAAWAAWACAAALLLARCLAAPDFLVRNTAVYLVNDPHGKLTPHLRKSNRSSRRSGRRSPATPSRGAPDERGERAERSEHSERTTTTELATAPDDSAPTSLMATPIKRDPDADLIEMTPRDRSTSP